MSSSLLPIYNRIPISFDHGNGVWLYDKLGKDYIDGATGIGVNALGYNHPDLIHAINSKSIKPIFIGNMYEIEDQENLGHDFREISQMHQSVFVNSGTEASEVSIKMARVYGCSKGIKNPIIIAFQKGFHGRTLGSLSATGNAKLKEGLGSLLPGFILLPFNDINAVKEIAATRNPDIIAVSLEPILGQGGVVVPDQNYLPELRTICNENNWLLMLDEIQTGMGRTGTFFAYQQHDDTRPDILTAAKCIGGGLPIGVCAANKKVSEVFTEGKHGTTFGGNPLSTHLGRTFIQIIKRDNLLENVRIMGDYLLDALKIELGNFSGISDIRGRGLMVGIELDRPCKGLYEQGIKAGVLFNITAENVIRLLPPYIITKDEADILVERLKKAITAFLMK